MARGTEAEQDARAALLDVLAEHDLQCWMFTDLVTIDEKPRVRRRQPPAYPQRRPAGAPPRAEPDWFSSLPRSHGLEVPTQPPVPRRYFGDPGWATS